MTHAEAYLRETAEIALSMDHAEIEFLALHLSTLRGRLFIIGLGGSAANASHAANDFVKLCALDAICLTDNTAEFTANANDSGWENAFVDMLVARNAGHTDALLVLSVGGGTDEVSLPLVKAIAYARQANVGVLGIVGRDGGATKKAATRCVVVPTVEPSRVTPHTESFQSVVLHCLVSHPKLQRNSTKW